MTCAMRNLERATSLVRLLSNEAAGGLFITVTVTFLILQSSSSCMAARNATFNSTAVSTATDKLVPTDGPKFERQEENSMELGRKLVASHMKPEPYKNADYFIVTDRVVWGAAKKICEDYKSVLTSVMTQDEMKFLQALTYKYNIVNYWIGGFRRYYGTSIKEFFWIENNKTVENWFWATEADGCKPPNCPEPNNAKDQGYGNEDCTEFNYHEKRGNDYGCTIAQAFICKRTCVDKTEYEEYVAENAGSFHNSYLLFAILFPPQYFFGTFFLFLTL